MHREPSKRFALGDLQDGEIIMGEGWTDHRGNGGLRTKIDVIRYIYIYAVVISCIFHVHPDPWENDPI